MPYKGLIFSFFKCFCNNLTCYPPTILSLQWTQHIALMGCCRSCFLILIWCWPWAKHFVYFPSLLFFDCFDAKSIEFAGTVFSWALTWAEDFISIQYSEFICFENEYLKTFPSFTLGICSFSKLRMFCLEFMDHSFALFPQRKLWFMGQDPKYVGRNLFSSWWTRPWSSSVWLG